MDKPLIEQLGKYERIEFKIDRLSILISSVPMLILVPYSGIMGSLVDSAFLKLLFILIMFASGFHFLSTLKRNNIYLYNKYFKIKPRSVK